MASDSPPIPVQPPSLSLGDIVHKLKTALEDETLYLDRTSGEMRVVLDEEIVLLGEIDEDLLPLAELAVVEGLRDVLCSSRWIGLPRWAEMEDPDQVEVVLAAMLTQAGFTLT